VSPRRHRAAEYGNRVKFVNHPDTPFGAQYIAARGSKRPGDIKQDDLEPF
jgi:hypothetical protein